MRRLSDEEIERHNRHYETGWKLIEGLILVHDTGPTAPPGWLARRRLRRAARCFEHALAISPRGWQSLWALGKIHQRPDDSREALRCFGRAFDISPDQPDVAREAAAEALSVGDGRLAVRYCRAAIEAMPGDPGLVANLALALLISGKPAEAQSAISEATQRAPQDPISAAVARAVDDVVQNRRPRPRTLADVL